MLRQNAVSLSFLKLIFLKNFKINVLPDFKIRNKFHAFNHELKLMIGF